MKIGLILLLAGALCPGEYRFRHAVLVHFWPQNRILMSYRWTERDRVHTHNYCMAFGSVPKSSNLTSTSPSALSCEKLTPASSKSVSLHICKMNSVVSTEHSKYSWILLYSSITVLLYAKPLPLNRLPVGRPYEDFRKTL